MKNLVLSGGGALGSFEADNNSFIICEICGNKLKQINNSHLQKHNTNLIEYKRMYPNSETLLSSIREKIRKSATEKIVSEETKNKLRNRICSKETKEKISKAIKGVKKSPEGVKNMIAAMIGRPVSEKTRKKMSEKLRGRFAGDKNPATRPDVRKKLITNHPCRTRPEEWKEIVQKRADKLRGVPFSKERKISMAKARMKSMKYGSKAQLLAFKFFRRIFRKYNIEVFSNDYTIFPEGHKKYNVDISVPKYRLAIEWDGITHRKPIYGKKIFLERVKTDVIKTKILSENGWKIIRIKDDNSNGNMFKKQLN